MAAADVAARAIARKTGSKVVHAEGPAGGMGAMKEALEGAGIKTSSLPTKPRPTPVTVEGGEDLLNQMRKEAFREAPEIASTPLVMGEQGIEGTLRTGSMWDDVRKLRGGKLDQAAGFAASVATNKYVLGGLAAGGIAGLTGYGGYAAATTQISMHEQTAKALNKARNSLAFGGSNRRQDFEHNPMMTFSRPRVRGGHMGASGGLTLAMSRNRTRS